MSTPVKKSYKILAILLLLVFMVGAIAQAQYKTQTVITLWCSMPQKYRPLFKELVDEYLKTTHGLVTVDIKYFENQDKLQQELLTASVKPDLALVDTEWQDVIEDHCDVLYAEDIMKQLVGNSIYISFKNDTHKLMWESCKKDGKLLTLPFASFNRALIVNNEILNLYEIKNKPKKMADLIAMGEKIKAARAKMGPDAKQHWIFYIPVNESPEVLADFYQVFLWQLGKDIWEPFMDGELAGFNNPEGKTALKLLVDMIHTYKLSPEHGNSKENCAFYIEAPGEYRELLEHGRDVEIVPWPGQKGTKNDFKVFGFMVFRGAGRQKLDKIWNLIYHLCEFQSAVKWSLTTHYLPPNKQVVLSPYYFDYMKAHPGIRIYLEQLKYSANTDMDQKKMQTMKILGENLKLALEKKMSVDECLETSCKSVDEVMDPKGVLQAKRKELRDMGQLIKFFWNKDYN